jgi:sec-independent protein translocase protein TatA
VFGLSPFELAAVGVVAILLFGSKLPDVAHSLGKQYRDLRRNLNDIQDQFREAQREVTRAIEAPVKELNNALSDVAVEEEKIREPSVPKFTPPPADEEA